MALDQSDYANSALCRVIGLCDGKITGIHAYAAHLHDQRFKQMEHQREVHEDLIGMGLG